MYPRNHRGQDTSSSQDNCQRCGSYPHRMGTWTRGLLSKHCCESWTENGARESNPILGHSSKLFADYFPCTPAYVSKEADPKVLKRFTQDLLFLGLNWSPNDPILSECYTDDLLQPFQDDHTDFSELLDRAKIPIRMRERAKKQVISIFRRVFVRSGGRIDNRQYDIDLDFSACENASLCAAQLRVSCSRPFGHFDLKEIHSAFSRSTIFVETSSSDIPNAMSGVCA